MCVCARTLPGRSALHISQYQWVTPDTLLIPAHSTPSSINVWVYVHVLRNHKLASDVALLCHQQIAISGTSFVQI